MNRWGPIYIIQVDSHGDELPEPDGTHLSNRVVERLRSTQAPLITDVVLACHGFSNDQVTATEFYSVWMGAMAREWADLDSFRRKRPNGFVPLLVGIAWPSRFYDFPTTRETCQTMAVATRRASVSTSRRLSLGRVSRALAPGRGVLSWATNAVSALAFSRFVSRAQKVGTSFGHELLGRLQRETASRSEQLPPVGYHLIGHSLGAHVAMCTVQGTTRDGEDPHWREVDSLLLVQAAVATDCFASPRGLYAGLHEAAVSGVTVVTHSKSDCALRRLYGFAHARWDVDALGARGVLHVPCDSVELSPDGPLRDVLRRGRLINADASQVIFSDESNGLLQAVFVGSHANITSPGLTRFFGDAVAVSCKPAASGDGVVAVTPPLAARVEAPVAAAPAVAAAAPADREVTATAPRAAGVASSLVPAAASRVPRLPTQWPDSTSRWRPLNSLRRRLSALFR